MFDCCTWHEGLFCVQKKYIQFSTFTLFLHFPSKKIKDSTGGVFLDISIRSLAWIFAASTWDSLWAIIDRKLDVLLLGSLFSFLRIVWVCRGGVRAPQADTGHSRVNIAVSNLFSILHVMYDSLSSTQEGGTQLNWGENLSVSAPLISKSKSKTSSCPILSSSPQSPSFPFSFSI